jgi:DNA replication protein DnaC
VRLTRLLPTLAIGHGDGSYLKTLAQLAKTEVLVIDEWALAPLTDESRRDLLEIFDDRHGTRSTIITSQLPVKHWRHGKFPHLADQPVEKIRERCTKQACGRRSSVMASQPIVVDDRQSLQTPFRPPTPVMVHLGKATIAPLNGG